MKIVTWNLSNRKANQQAWEALFELDPDIALLSEVNFIPDDLNGYNSYFEYSMGDKDKPRNFKTGIITKGKIVDEIPLIAQEDWITNCLGNDTGNLVARKIRFADGITYNVISAYLANTPYPHEKYTDDITSVVLPNFEKIFMSEILWAVLKHILSHHRDPWIIGGDFNTSELYGTRKERASYLEIIKRLERLKLKEVVRHYNNGPVPTWKSRYPNSKLIHQLDHLYVSDVLLENSYNAYVGDYKKYVGNGLSDHMPIIADFLNSRL